MVNTNLKLKLYKIKEEGEQEQVYNRVIIITILYLIKQGFLLFKTGIPKYIKNSLIKILIFRFKKLSVEERVLCLSSIDKLAVDSIIRM